MRHRSRTGQDCFRDKPQHGLCQVKPYDLRARMLVLQESRKSALSAPNIDSPPAGKIAEIFKDQLNVVNPRVDGGREMLLVSGRFIEASPDFFKTCLWLA